MKILIFLFSINIFAFDAKTIHLSSFTACLVHELAYLEQLSNEDINSFNIAFSQNSAISENTDKFLFKQLLNKGIDLSPKEVVLDQKLFDSFKSKVSDITDKRKFSKTVLSSFLQDIGELLTDPLYSDYMKMKRFNKQNQSSEFKIYLNKVRLVAPWISLILDNNQEEANLKLDEIQRSLFQGLVDLAKVSARTKTSTDFKKIDYISKLDIDLERARSEIDKLDFVISPAADPSYTPPTKLPEEVDNWVPVDENIIENGIPLTRDRLFPEPDPEYIAPEVLPTPVDKWQQ